MITCCVQYLGCQRADLQEILTALTAGCSRIHVHTCKCLITSHAHSVKSSRQPWRSLLHRSVKPRDHCIASRPAALVCWPCLLACNTSHPLMSVDDTSSDAQEFVAIAGAEAQRQAEPDAEKRKYPGGAFDPFGLSKNSMVCPFPGPPAGFPLTPPMHR